MEHPGLRARGRREAAAKTLTEVAYKTRVDIGKLSKYERAVGNLTPAEQERLDAVLDDAVRARVQALDAVMETKRSHEKRRDAVTVGV